MVKGLEGESGQWKTKKSLLWKASHLETALNFTHFHTACFTTPESLFNITAKKLHKTHSYTANPMDSSETTQSGFPSFPYQLVVWAHSISEFRGYSALEEWAHKNLPQGSLLAKIVTKGCGLFPKIKSWHPIDGVMFHRGREGK